MGANNATPEKDSINKSDLIMHEIVHETVMFIVKRCLCKNIRFCNSVLLQYEKKAITELPKQIANSATLKPISDRYFTSQSLIKQLNFARSSNHPSIVRVYATLLEPNLSSLFLKVEPVLLCKQVINDITDAEFINGLQSILQALHYLHTRVFVSHNNMQLESIFCDSNRKWKLCGFEYSMPFDDITKHKLEVIECLKGHNIDQKAIAYDTSYPHCYDVYCFSRMVLDTLTNSDVKIDKLSAVLKKTCLHDLPNQRLPTAELLQHPIFRDPFSYISTFFANYTLKNDSEKYTFFEEFPSLIADLPEELFCTRIVPALLSPVVITDHPAQHTIGLLLTPNKDEASTPDCKIGLVSENIFQLRLAPQITMTFRLRELNTRLLLLAHFPAYARLLGIDALQHIILPEVCLGLYDSSDTLINASLAGLSHLAFLLGPGIALSHLTSLGDQLKHKNLFSISSTTHSSSMPFVTQLSLGRSKPPLIYWANKPWWRCPNLFPDSAPKVDRKAQVMVLNEKIKSGSKIVPRRLCDVASHSSEYTPRKIMPASQYIPSISKHSRSRTNPNRSFSKIFSSLGELPLTALIEADETVSEKPKTPLIIETKPSFTNVNWNDWEKCPPSSHTSPLFDFVPKQSESKHCLDLLQDEMDECVLVDKLLADLEPVLPFTEHPTLPTNITTDTKESPKSLNLRYKPKELASSDWEDVWNSYDEDDD